MKVYICHYVNMNYEGQIDEVCQNVKSAMSCIEGHLRDLMDEEDFKEFWKEHQQQIKDDLIKNEEVALNDYYADDECYKVELKEVW